MSSLEPSRHRRPTLRRLRSWFQEFLNTNDEEISGTSLAVGDAYTCPRKDTVEELARILNTQRVVHVRGTPAPGKTTLAHLLYYHYRKQNTPVVLFDHWPTDDCQTYNVLVKGVREQGYDVPDYRSLHYMDIAIIVDEAQQTYNDNTFWTGIIHAQCHRSVGPVFCLFAAYGSAFEESSNSDGGTPKGFLGPQRLVSVTPSTINKSPRIALFFNCEEFDDVVTRICNDPRERLPLDCSAYDYIFNLTYGHPGAVRGTLKMLHVERYLTNTSIPFPLEKYPDIGTLARAVLERFSSRNLSCTTRVGIGAITRPVEAAYQDEFYRALHAVLGSAANVTSEWTSEGGGRIDFRIANVGWEIELLREDNRLREHCERFTGNGLYGNWIQKGLLMDWLIIDCRTSRPEPYNVPGTRLWRAVFSGDFTSVELLDQANNIITPRFPLMS
ncbi:hypothetical protein VTN49DRAFT_3035 [Thermomyces lanuginosus]|uniref:uncharacterized protein n=1 Tax=Thermomyces lanuginosus TaxID=5541 RepID=UPI0037438CA8